MGSWAAWLSERLSPDLDYAINGKSSELYMAARESFPSDLRETVPMTFPMTHPVTGCPGVAKYPVDEWERAGGALHVCQELGKALHAGGSERPHNSPAHYGRCPEVGR